MEGAIRGEGGVSRPFMEQILQLHSQMSMSRGARMVSWMAPQWPLPLWRTCSLIVR